MDYKLIMRSYYCVRGYHFPAIRCKHKSFYGSDHLYLTRADSAGKHSFELAEVGEVDVDHAVGFLVRDGALAPDEVNELLSLQGVIRPPDPGEYFMHVGLYVE